MPANQRTGQYNANRLLRELWLNPGLSRVQLAQRLDLDKSTVTHMVNRMEKQGFLTTLSEGNASSKGGRKPLALGIRGESAYFLGLEIQPGSIVQTLVDLQGRIIANDILPLDSGGKIPLGKTGSALTDLYRSYSRDYALMAVGVGFSGIINPYEGKIIKSMLLDIDQPCSVNDLFESPLPCPLIIENDANCCTWGEILSSSGEKEENILFLLLESDFFHENSSRPGRFSLGMGFSLNGRVYHGEKFRAGEFLSTQWIRDKRTQFSLSYEELARIGGEREIRRALFEEISRNAAFLANTLDLDRICVGGDIEPFWHELEVTLEESIGINSSYPGLGTCRCTLSSKGQFAVSYGAAVMPLMQVFSTEPDVLMGDQLQGREGLEKFRKRITNGGIL